MRLHRDAKDVRVFFDNYIRRGAHNAEATTWELVSRTMDVAVAQHFNRTFDILKLLAIFLPPPVCPPLRLEMRRHEAIFAGSTVLYFLDSKPIPANCILDIFTPVQGAYSIFIWLLNCGCEELPPANAKETWFLKSLGPSAETTITSVRMLRTPFGRRIQIFGCRHSAVEAILHVHSSAFCIPPASSFF